MDAPSLDPHARRSTAPWHWLLPALLALFGAAAPDTATAAFYSAGVAGGAFANDGNQPCTLPGGFSESYRTYPEDAFRTYAEGIATSFNPCSALSGSPHSFSSAKLSTGQLRVYALAQLSEPPFLQEARAYAYFSDDVLLFHGGTLIDELPGGLVGEIRLSIHGSRSAELVDASAELEVRGLEGNTIGDAEIDDMQGGEVLVVQFTTPFHFFASMSLVAGDGQFADFGSTGTLSIELPAGYSFGSSSGVLLAVPEPSGWALLLVGLGGVAAAARRRQAAA